MEMFRHGFLSHSGGCVRDSGSAFVAFQQRAKVTNADDLKAYMNNDHLLLKKHRDAIFSCPIKQKFFN